MRCAAALSQADFVVQFRAQRKLAQTTVDNIAASPSLPGCVCQGRSRSEATDNIRAAVEDYLVSLNKHGDPIPPSVIEAVIQVSV